MLQHVVGGTPPNITVEGDSEWFSNSTVHLKFFKVFNSLPRGLNFMNVCFSKRQRQEKPKYTLIAIMRTAAITSNDPPSTQLLSKSRSYSQIAVAFSTVAILVMWPITSTLARFTMCSRQLLNVLCYYHNYQIWGNNLWKLIVGCTLWFVLSSGV